MERVTEKAVRWIEIENVTKNDLSFQLWYDKKKTKSYLRIGDSGKYKLELPKGTYRRVAIMSAYQKR